MPRTNLTDCSDDLELVRLMLEDVTESELDRLRSMPASTREAVLYFVARASQRVVEPPLSLEAVRDFLRHYAEDLLASEQAVQVVLLRDLEEHGARWTRLLTDRECGTRPEKIVAECVRLYYDWHRQMPSGRELTRVIAATLEVDDAAAEQLRGVVWDSHYFDSLWRGVMEHPSLALQYRLRSAPPAPSRRGDKSEAGATPPRYARR